MAGFGRGSRTGKRPPSSSHCSTVTIVLFVAFCVLAVWMLSPSSSFVSSSSQTATHATLRSRASLSSFSKPSPSLFFKDPGDGGDDFDRRGGRGGGGREVGEEEEAEVGDAGENPAEEKLSAPVLSKKVDTYAEERDKDNKAESQSGDGAFGVDENQAEEEQPRKQGRQEEGDGSEEESRREHPTNVSTEESEQEGSPATGLDQEEQGNEGNQELPTQTADGDSSDDSREQSLTREETAEQSVQLEEEGQTQTQQDHSNGENEDQQQQSSQEETENAGGDNQQQQETDDGGDSIESQQQSQTDDAGGNIENQQQSQQEQEDAKGGHDQMQRTEEAGGAKEQEQTVEQSEKEESNEDRGVVDSEVFSGEESQQGGNEEKLTDEPNVGEPLTDQARKEVPTDGPGGKKTPWSTQSDQSQNEKERRESSRSRVEGGGGGGIGGVHGYEWKLCNLTTGPDYIPCLDNEEALRHLHATKHYEHRERHCPEEAPTCLVPLPKGYRKSIEWPKSRERIWYNNVPHTKLAVVKGHQNWVKLEGEYLTFPGGGTQFIHGALHYIEFIQKSVRNIAWGKHTRVILDVGCGVASFGGTLFEKDVLTMSFAPKDEHEAQVQLALERGIPAISAVMGSQRLPFPSRVFDIVHCARCRVPWHAGGGALLLELNRVLRPGGYFVWSATPVYQKLQEDVEIWKAMTSLTKSMCWDLVTIRKDRLNSVAAAFYRKPTSNECYDNRKNPIPPMCADDDDPDAAWYVPLQSCMHRVPTDASKRGSRWPEEWPRRLRLAPQWLDGSQVGVYGKPAPDDFTSDYGHWKQVVSKSYLHGLGVDWSKVRNVMDMRAVYGGFAAALKDLKIWVMNVVNIDSPDTLPIIYERGLFGIYHDWCESFSTYPRTYDLLHADKLFLGLKNRCNLVPVLVEVDRILRPGGKLIVRDESNIVSEVESILKSLHWEVRLTFSKNREGIICAEKSYWRPETVLSSS